MKRILVGAAAGADLAATVSVPAWALTDSGTISCSGGAHRAVRGEQQRLGDHLTLKLGGTTVWSGYNVYAKSYVSGGSGTSSWSASSVSLLLSGSYGFCEPL
jgi:hypothetical protein